MESIASGLAAIVGSEHVLDDATSLTSYAADESFVAGAAPWAVARPRSAEEVQRLVAWANETGTPLVPVSSGPPHFHGDTVPSVPGAVIVDLRRMKRILRVDRRNRMAVIEPGVTYPQLQSALREEGLRITPPLAPRADKSVIASLLERQPTLIPRYNFHLPEPLRSCGVVWGSGVTMFTGEAGAGPESLETQWRAGGVQADAKGPGQTDFFRLLTGAQGSMGIVTWAAVRCEIVPTAHRLAFVPAGTLRELVDLTYRVCRVRLGDELLIVNDAFLARLTGASSGEDAPGVAARRAALPPWTLIVGLGGREHFAEERVAAAEQDLRELAEQHGLAGCRAVPGAATGEVAQALGESGDAPWRLAAKGACADIFFLTTLEKAPAYVDTMLSVAASRRYPADEVGVYVQPQHQGVTHHVEFNLPYGPGNPREADRVRALFHVASARLIADGAYFSRPYGPWAQPVYNRDAASRDALRKVKAIFDPNGVMNPGKLCFGGPARIQAPVGNERPQATASCGMHGTVALPEREEA